MKLFNIITFILLGSSSLMADTPPQVINKTCASNQYFNKIAPGSGNITCAQPSYSGLTGLPAFIDSLNLISSNVSLVNDSASPGNSKYYGTNSSGTKGYFSLPTSVAWGSITGTLSNQTDLQTALNAKQNTLTEGNLTEATSSVLTITGGTSAVIGSGTSIQVKQASTSQSGYLSSTDWNTFNNKATAGNYLSLTGGTLTGTLNGTTVSANHFTTSNTPGSGSSSEQFGLTALAPYANTLAVGYNASAANLNAIAIGTNSIVAGPSGIAIGTGASAGSSYSTSLGYAAISSTNGVAIGGNAYAAASDVSIGYSAGDNLSNGTSISIGVNSNHSNQGSANISIGYNSEVTNTSGTNNIAIGTAVGPSNFTGTRLVLLGDSADVNNDGLTNAIAIGANAKVSASNSMALGGTGGNAVKVGIANATPAYPLDVTGTGHFSQFLIADLAVGGASFIPTGSTVPTNGLYLPSANTLGFSTNSTNAGAISSTGGWTLGSASSSSSTVHSAYVGNAASAGASLRFQVIPTDSGGFASIGRTVNDGVMALVSDVNAPAVNSGAGLYVYGSTHATKASVTEFYNAGSLTGSISAAGAWVTTGTSTAASFIPTSSTVPANGMYLSGANTVGFSTNTTLAGSINASQVWDIGTSAGQQTIEGGLIIKNVKNAVQAVIVNGASAYTGANHYGFSVTGSTNVSNTAAYGLYSQQTTAASSATTISSNYFADGVIKGASASLTNHVEFLSSGNNRNATNNAVLTDSSIFTGNYGINLSTSNPSVITGPTAIGGTTTNNNAATGFVGEYIESVISTATNVPGATTVWGNMTSISLPAGDWDVSLNGNFVNNAATAETFAFAAISVNSGATTTDQVIGSNQQSTFVPTASRDSFVTISNYRLSLASTTTVYAKCALDYATGNPQFRGRISARRMR